MTAASTDSDSLDVVQQCKWKPLDSGDEVRNDDRKVKKKADRFSSHGFTVSDMAQVLLAKLSDF
jgi:hypothetical protein